MGMFDTIKCEYPLPDPEVQDSEFQTKDLVNFMGNYTITKEGRLIYHFVEWEAVPKEELPYRDNADPLLRMTGSIRKKAGSEEDIDQEFHGYLNFYTSIESSDEHPYTWYDYHAKFTDGNLVEIKRLNYDPA